MKKYILLGFLFTANLCKAQVFTVTDNCSSVIVRDTVLHASGVYPKSDLQVRKTASTLTVTRVSQTVTVAYWSTATIGALAPTIDSGYTLLYNYLSHQCNFQGATGPVGATGATGATGANGVCLDTVTAGNGLTRTGNSVGLGGPLDSSAFIQLGTYGFGFTDGPKVFAVNPPDGSFLTALTDCENATSYWQLDTLYFVYSIGSKSTGIVSALKIDTFESYNLLELGGLRYQSGAFDNNATHTDPTTELSIHHIGKHRDVSSDREHYMFTDWMVSDSVNEFPAGSGVKTIDSIVTVTHGNGLAAYGVSAFSVKVKQDTMVTFSFDSARSKIWFYGQRSDTVSIGSDKPIKTTTLLSENILIPGGSLGIGTASALTPLHVHGQVRFESLPVFTDNDDALDHDLEVGDLYRTGDVLKIVH